MKKCILLLTFLLFCATYICYTMPPKRDDIYTLIGDATDESATKQTGNRYSSFGPISERSLLDDCWATGKASVAYAFQCCQLFWTSDENFGWCNPSNYDSDSD